MELLRAITLALRPRRADEGDVAGDTLPGGAAAKQAQQGRQIGPPGKDLFDTHHRDMHARNGCRHPNITLVLDQNDRTRLGDDKIRSGNTDIRPEKSLPQGFPGHASELRNVSIGVGAQVVMKELRHLLS